MVSSRNQAESVVALLAVIGIKIAELPLTKTLITPGLRAFRPANVSSGPISCILARTETCYNIVPFASLTNAHSQTPGSHGDDYQFRMLRMRHHREIWQNQLLRSRRLLVQKLWRCWQHKSSPHVVRGYSGLQSTTITVQVSHWAS